MIIHNSRMLVCFALITSVAALGCGNQEIKTVRTEGKITYGGGPWPVPAKAFFACEKPAEGYTQHVGTADIAKDGSFRATTFENGDGLVPGSYVVNLECWEVPPSMENPAAAKSYIPQKFQSGAQSGFKFDVPATGKKVVEVNFDVPKP